MPFELDIYRDLVIKYIREVEEAKNKG